MSLSKGYRISLFVLFFLLSVSIVFGGRSRLVELDEDNWHEMLEGEWMVEFFAPWCPACKALQPIWKEFATWSDDLGIKVGQVDVTASPGLSGRFMVTALPTIFHIKEGIFRQYRGSREKDELITFIEEKKWQALDEIPAWKSPAAYHMSVLSQFFKLSMVLRGAHTTLVEDYGLPTWGSYAVFALATIFIGAMLGLILVCVIDFLFPPKMVAPISTMKTSTGKNSDEEDLIEDREKDDSSEEMEEEEEEEEELEDESEGERIEKSEDEKLENSEPEGNEGNASATSSPNVRKRRARKAD